MSTTHPSPTAGTSQCARILQRLSETPGEWVPMPVLVKLSGSYVIHSRIADLRNRGNRIDHRNKIMHRQCHSEYRLVEAAPDAMAYVNCGSGQDYGICTVCGKGHGHVAFSAAPPAYPPGDPAMPCAHCGQPMIRVRASDFDGWSCMSTPCCVYRVASSQPQP